MSRKNAYPYGLVAKVARAAEITPEWASKVLNSHVSPGLEVAIRIDASGLVPGRNFVAEVVAAAASRVA